MYCFVLAVLIYWRKKKEGVEEILTFLIDLGIRLGEGNGAMDVHIITQRVCHFFAFIDHDKKANKQKTNKHVKEMQ